MKTHREKSSKVGDITTNIYNNQVNISHVQNSEPKTFPRKLGKLILSMVITIICGLIIAYLTGLLGLNQPIPFKNNDTFSENKRNTINNTFEEETEDNIVKDDEKSVSPTSFLNEPIYDIPIENDFTISNYAGSDFDNHSLRIRVNSIGSYSDGTLYANIYINVGNQTIQDKMSTNFSYTLNTANKSYRIDIVGIKLHEFVKFDIYIQ